MQQPHSESFYDMLNASLFFLAVVKFFHEKIHCFSFVYVFVQYMNDSCLANSEINKLVSLMRGNAIGLFGII